MSTNIKLVYLFRDAGNYKRWGEIIFSNPDGLEIDFIEGRLRQAFLQDGLFIASQIHIPDLFLYETGNATDDDHCFHEFYSIEPTDAGPNDQWRRSMRMFIGQVEFVAGRGWRAYFPSSSLI